MNNKSINKKWIVYNTVNSSLTGWHSFMDSYILDFTDNKNLKIKTLGEDECDRADLTSFSSAEASGAVRAFLR